MIVKILFLVEGLSQGGTETPVLTLGRQLRRLGHHITIYTSGGPWVFRARHMGIHVVTDSNLFRLGHREVANLASHLNEHLNEHPYAIVHAHDRIGFSLFNRGRAMLRYRPPLVFTVHGSYVTRYTLATVVRISHAVITVSDALRSQLPPTSRRTATIPNGIDMNRFRPMSNVIARKLFTISPQAFVIGYAGRFTVRKKHLGVRISHALEDYARHTANTRVLIAGKGSHAQMKSSRTTSVLGHLDNMNAFYNACDIVVGTGRVAAESLACGRPTIMISLGGFQGLVTSRNLRQAINHNFGDHVRGNRGWTKSELHHQITWIRNHLNDVRLDTGHARVLINDSLSSRRMAEQTLTVYKSITEA